MQENDVARHTFTQILTAEAFGTFLLTFTDSAVGIVDETTGGSIGVLGRSLAAVTVVTTMIFSVGEISGAHINPAVTFAFAVRRVFPWARVAAYWAVQIAGALVAGLLLQFLFGADIDHGLTKPRGPIALSFATEVILTWFLVSSIVMSSDASNVQGWQAAFPVSATLLFCGLVGKDISGASMNPARSLGTAVVSGELSTIWIYLCAPMMGALLGTLTAYLIHGRPPRKEMKAARGG